MQIDLFFRWYDLWIGAYVDTQQRAVYICPVPCCGVRVSWADWHTYPFRVIHFGPWWYIAYDRSGAWYQRWPHIAMGRGD